MTTATEIRSHNETRRPTSDPPDLPFAPPVRNGSARRNADHSAADAETLAIEANEEFHATIVERARTEGVLVDATEIFPDL
jgi:hypothetical protein